MDDRKLREGDSMENEWGEGKEAVTENGIEGLVFVSVWRRINTAGTSGEAFCHLSPE